MATRKPMRLPIRSEADAFRFTYALAFVVGISLLLGYLVEPIAGIALFTLVAIGAIVWDLTSEEPGASELRQAEQAGHERGARDRRRVLVVANEALAGEALRERILPGAEPPPVLEVVAPVLQSKSHFVTTDIDRETEDARRRLRDTLAWAREHGIEATGEVGDPIDPLAGIEDELRRYDIDEVIVATHPPERANWLEMGTLDRVRDELSVPVTHVVIGGEPRESSPPEDERRPAHCHQTPGTRRHVLDE
jgi:hypothetical protein